VEKRALRIARCEPRWPRVFTVRHSTVVWLRARFTSDRVSRASEVAANETHAPGRAPTPFVHDLSATSAVTL
jgi:hypothetical protein